MPIIGSTLGRAKFVVNQINNIVSNVNDTRDQPTQEALQDLREIRVEDYAFRFDTYFRQFFEVFDPLDDVTEQGVIINGKPDGSVFALGTPFDDTIEDTQFDGSFITAGSDGGDDTIDARAGLDTVFGGDGDDMIRLDLRGATAEADAVFDRVEVLADERIGVDLSLGVADFGAMGQSVLGSVEGLIATEFDGLIAMGDGTGDDVRAQDAGGNPVDGLTTISSMGWEYRGVRLAFGEDDDQLTGISLENAQGGSTQDFVNADVGRVSGIGLAESTRFSGVFFAPGATSGDDDAITPYDLDMNGDVIPLTGATIKPRA